MMTKSLRAPAADASNRPVRLDTRRPLVLDTRELGRRPGSMRELVLDVAAPEGLGSSVIGVPAGTTIHLDVRLEAVMEGVLVTATGQLPLTGECGRCLEPLSLQQRIRVQELFVYPGEQAEDEEEDLPELIFDHLDLEPAVRDAVVLDLPARPLCDPDCAGLCVDCGLRLDDLEPDHEHQRSDPRWATLQGLTLDESTAGPVGTNRPASTGQARSTGRPEQKES
jgi:uncharacterized protein